MSQPVEQFGVAGPFAQDAEVAASGHQPAAEVVLPDTVDHDPRGQRVVARGDRTGELEPAAAARKRCLITPKDRQEMPGDLGTRRAGIAADQERHVLG
jgi:hypothetical protein